MDFVLRIFFSGLIAFVPSKDGKELTVLMINTPHQYKMADGTTLAHHKPLLLARAANCENTCRTDEYPSIAEFLFANKTPQEAFNALNGAILGGGAWQLSSSELRLVGPEEPLSIQTHARGRDENGTLHRVPMTPAEREDFSWVADLSDLAPGIEGFKDALTAAGDPGELVAARLKLRSGQVITYSMIRIDGKVRPIHFRKPSGEGPDAPYAQALANWVQATIHIHGEGIEIVDEDFRDKTRSRSMKLRPQGNAIEIALLNLPPFEAPPPDAPARSPQPGQHFQIYYDLAKTAPTKAARLVPHQPLNALASDPQAEWGALHPRAALWSDLLENLGLSPRGKGPYEVALCPITKE